MWLNTKNACKFLDVHPNTLRNWDKEGKIETKRTPGNHRLYNVHSIDIQSGDIVIYARVSSRNQRDDIAGQIRQLSESFPDAELVQDFGSGLNFKRKGFISLLERVLSRDVSKIVVAHKDRLCRFGFEIIEWLCAKQGCQLVVLNDTQLSPQEELVSDLIFIIHVFSCRIYGLRKYTSKITKDKDLPKKQRKV